MNTFNEDSRRFLSDSRRVMDTGARCFTAAAPAVTS
jgi:hypothetical protein